jgi:NADPH2:quinone reductase
VPYLESGVVVPPVSGVFPLEGAGEAIAQLEERRVLGMLVLVP